MAKRCIAWHVKDGWVCRYTMLALCIKEDKIHDKVKLQLMNKQLYHELYNMSLKEGRGIYSYISGSKYDGK